MTWLGLIGGIVLVLLGLVWIGQGLNLLGGSAMSGQAMWAIIGLVVALVGAWLLWTAARGRRSPAVRT
jgi:multisubunit Na+/H+ antiporter MnhB subunit